MAAGEPGARSVRGDPEGRAVQADVLDLSAWASPTALKDFARSGTHAPTSQGLSTQMRDAKFATWQVSSDELPLDWTEAFRRLT